MGYKNVVRQQRFQINWYHERRRRVISRLGGKCAKCGTTEGTLSVASIAFGSGEKKLNYSKAWATLLEEIKTRELLCAPCIEAKWSALQAERHSKHGTWSRWRHGKCRCKLCVRAKDKLMRRKKAHRAKMLAKIMKNRIADAVALVDKHNSH